MVTRKPIRKTTRRRERKYKVRVEQVTESKGLSREQAMKLKCEMNKKVGRRKGVKVKIV